MSLTVVSVPIGNYGDITLRAIETLRNSEIIICEELKPARVLLKRIGISEKELFNLNEHSKPEDLHDLVKLCQTKNVTLISDAGTPGFFDPGADLVKKCYENRVTVDVNPGASSLMAFFALSGEVIGEFYFVGFLPAEKLARSQRISELRSLRMPLVVMDTPYRLKSTLHDLSQVFGSRMAVLGIDLTGEKHQLRKDTLQKLAQQDWPKAPFVLMIV